MPGGTDRPTRLRAPAPRARRVRERLGGLLGAPRSARRVRIQVSGDEEAAGPFPTASPGDAVPATPSLGYGARLAVVQAVVAAHGGVISTERAAGRGTTFSILLPRGELPEPARAPASAAQAAGGRVLLIDDDEAFLRTASRLLGRLGYSVRALTSPAEAVELLRAAPDGFDVVITDLCMPGLTGFEVAEAIRAFRCDLPIVLSSGGEACARSELLERGIGFCLEKPYTRASLSSVLSRALGHG